MELRIRPIAAALSPAVKALRPSRDDFSRFSTALNRYLSRIDEKESEENHKTHLIDVFKAIYPVDVVIEQHERIDCVIRGGGKETPPVVLIETKTQRNRAEMITRSDINRKALHEAVLYYMRERISGNVSITHIIICSTFEFYIFAANQFERAFFNETRFRKLFQDWTESKTSDVTTDFFYRQIVRPFVAASDVQIEATYFDVRNPNEKDLLAIYKVLSPQNLLKDILPNDSNALNKDFYDELLYIIGVEEVRNGAKKVIRRRSERTRSSGSLIELALIEVEQSDALNSPELILKYGSNTEERAYTVALELCMTWVNRLLFLKLLEAQLVRFHEDADGFEFLNANSIHDFSELANLFFLVLAVPRQERPSRVSRYLNIPYLNSSLFERTQMEQIVDISSLGNREKMLPFSRTALRDNDGRKLKSTIPTLSYILGFLGAYDFGSAPGGEIKENNKGLISASVLGLIFEKINGYKDGAVFTPGIVTMNMSRRVIEAIAIKAFKQSFPTWEIDSVTDISNQITDRSTKSILRLNAVIDQLKICDPSVGSGHFLVSCLNELIALKSRIGILADRDGVRITDYEVEVDNDELVVLKSDSDEVFSYRVYAGHAPPRLQHIQQSLFEEKRKLIENCLFGVDINNNSARICQLRLWIELLKNAFYRDDGTLETLPNIDINIKVGDSLLSRFPLDQSLSSAFKLAGLTVSQYRSLVDAYKNTRDKFAKRQLEDQISNVKRRFQQEALGRLNQSLKTEVVELRAREAQSSLFNANLDEEKDGRPYKKAAQSRIAKLEERLASEVKRKTFLTALEWRFEFPEVLSERGEFQGFDVIIGNPPYGVPVRDERREIISRTLGRVPDHEIYYMFINQARRLLKTGGILSFIIPNMILSNVYAKNYRLNLLSEWSDLEIDDLTEFRVFADAVVHNVIITATKGDGRKSLLFRKTGITSNINDYLIQPQESVDEGTLIKGNRNWGLVFRLSPEVVGAVSDIQNGTVTLSSLFSEISQGLIAYDKYQGQSDSTIRGRVFHSNHPTASNSHWINGEDVRRFSVQWNGSDYIEYGDHLANPRKPKFFRQPRVLVREITNPRIFTSYTTGEAFNDPAVINILESDDARFPLKALEAILNSKLATFYHFNSSPKATKGAFPKILVEDIREFPIPSADGNEEALIHLSVLADDIRKRVSDLTREAELEELELELDRAVYSLYRVDLNTISIIEKGFVANEKANKRDRLPELSRVALRVKKRVRDQELPAGSIGTIVYAYEGAAAYEVEFVEPMDALLTLEDFEIAALN